MSKLWKWSRRGLVAVLIAAAVWLVVDAFVLPPVAHYFALDTLHSLGLEDATLDVRSASLYGVRLSDLRTGGDRLKVGTIDVNYRPASLARGRVRSIELTGVVWQINIEDGRVSLAPFDRLETGGGGGELPFDEVVLRSSIVRIDWKGLRLSVPFEGRLATRENGVLAVELSLGLPGSSVDITGTLTPDEAGGAGARTVAFRIDAFGARSRVDGRFDPASGVVTLNSDVRLTEKADPILKLAYDRNADGSLATVTLDGAWENRGIGVDGGLLSAERIDLRGTLALKDHTQLTDLHLHAEASGLARGNQQLAQRAVIELNRATEGDGFALTVDGEGEGWSARLGAALPGVATWLDPGDELAIGTDWELKGRPAVWLLSALETAGVVLQRHGQIAIAGEAVGRLRTGDASPARARWAVDLRRMQMTWDGVDVRLLRQGLAVNGLAADLQLTGTVTPDDVVLDVAPGSRLAWESVGSTDAAEEMRIGAAALRVPARDEGLDTAFDPRSHIAWRRDAGSARAALRLRTTSPVTFDTGAVNGTVNVLRLGGAWSREPSDSGSAASPTFGAEVRVEGATVAVPRANLELRGVSVTLPIVDGRTLPTRGLIRVEEVRYKDKALEPINGDAVLADGRLTADLYWPISKRLLLRGDASIDLFAGGGPTGVVHFLLPQFTLTDADRETLAGLGLRYGDLKAEGAFAARGRLDLVAGRVQPRLTVSTFDAAVRSEAFTFAAVGINGSVTFDSFAPLTTPGNQRFKVERLSSGALTFRDGFLGLQLEPNGTLLIERTEWTWGADGQVRAHALRVAPGDSVLSAELFIENLDLGEWLKVLEMEYVKAEGQLFGRVPIAIDLTEPDRIEFGDGFLFALPPQRPGQAVNPYGVLKFPNTAVVEQVLEQSGAFTADQRLQQVKQRLVNALTDYEYEQLNFRFIPKGEGKDKELTLQIQTSGKGAGPDGQQIGSLTVNVNGFGALVRQSLIMKRGSEKSIDSALDRFFQ